MENLVLGIGTVAICSLLYWFAWRKARHGKIYVALFAIVVCGLLLRVYVASDGQLHEWDERYHALVAKHLIDQPLQPTLYDRPVLSFDYRDWTGNHVWVHKQPLPLWTMAASLRIFGLDELALRLPSVLLSTIAIWLTFQIALYFFDERTALLAAFLHSIHGLTIEFTGGRVATDHIDVFFLFFVELAVFFAICLVRRPKWTFSLLVGLAIGAAILTKWLPALIVLPIFGILAMAEPWKKRAVLVHGAGIGLAAALVALPWQWYITSAFPLESAWESAFNSRHLFEGLDGHGRPWYYHWRNMLDLFGSLVFIPVLWFTWRSLQALFRGNGKPFAITIWIWVPYLFFTLAMTKMQGYILFTAPAIFMITAWCWFELRERKPRGRARTWLNYSILFLLLGFPVHHSLERTKAFRTYDRHPAWVQELEQLDRRWEHPEKTVLLNVDRPIEAMFYSDVIAYGPRSVDPSEIQDLISDGYRVYDCASDNGLECKAVR